MTDAEFDQVLEAIAEGSNTKNALEVLGIPQSTFRHYRAKESSRLARYVRARADSAEALEIQALETSLRALRGEVSPQAAKVHADTALRVAAIRSPSTHGNKLELTVNENHGLAKAREARMRLIGDSSTKRAPQVLEHAPQSAAVVPAPEPVTPAHSAQIEALLS